MSWASAGRGALEQYRIQRGMILITLHRDVDDEMNWYLTCSAVGITAMPMKAVLIEMVKAEALTAVRRGIERLELDMGYIEQAVRQ